MSRLSCAKQLMSAGGRTLRYVVATLIVGGWVLMCIGKSMRFANLRPDLPEASLAAHFEYLCTLEGAERMAYVPVVASGSVLSLATSSQAHKSSL